MKLRKEHLALAAIFLIVLSTRLLISFSRDTFDYGAYAEISKVENVRDNIIVQFDDGLHYEPHPFLPMFHYLLAFFTLFLPMGIVLKVIPNLLASLSVVFAFMVSYELTKDRLAGLFSAIAVGFVPVFFSFTVNSVSPYSLVVPMTLLMVYLFMKLDPGTVLYFVIVLFALILTDPSSLIFVISLAIYIVLLYILGAKSSKGEVEVALFSVLAAVWMIFLFFKESLLANGLSIIWQNVRGDAGFILTSSIYSIGALTFAGGIFITYKNLFEKKRKDIHVLMALALSTMIFLGLGIIGSEAGFLFLGVFFAVMSGEMYVMLIDYFKKTHFSKHYVVFGVLLVFVLFLTSGVPAFVNGSSTVAPQIWTISAMEWLKAEEPGSVVFADLEEGNIVSAVARHKNVIDDQPIPSSDYKQRLEDLEELYTTQSRVDAVNLIQKYGISFIVVTESALTKRNITGLKYNDPDCFDLVYENKGVSVYKPLCKVSG